MENAGNTCLCKSSAFYQHNTTTLQKIKLLFSSVKSSRQSTHDSRITEQLCEWCGELMRKKIRHRSALFPPKHSASLRNSSHTAEATCARVSRCLQQLSYFSAQKNFHIGKRFSDLIWDIFRCAIQNFSSALCRRIVRLWKSSASHPSDCGNLFKSLS